MPTRRKLPPVVITGSDKDGYSYALAEHPEQRLGTVYNTRYDAEQAAKRKGYTVVKMETHTKKLPGGTVNVHTYNSKEGV